MAAFLHTTMPSLQRPILRDPVLWSLTLHDHRRSLFERFLATHPALLTTRRTDIDVWRARLSGPRLARLDDTDTIDTASTTSSNASTSS